MSVKLQGLRVYAVLGVQVTSKELWSSSVFRAYPEGDRVCGFFGGWSFLTLISCVCADYLFRASDSRRAESEPGYIKDELPKL